MLYEGTHKMKLILLTKSLFYIEDANRQFGGK